MLLQYIFASPANVITRNIKFKYSLNLHNRVSNLLVCTIIEFSFF